MASSAKVSKAIRSRKKLKREKSRTRRVKSVVVKRLDILKALEKAVS